MRHRLSGLSTYRLKGQAREMSTPPTLHCSMVPFTFYLDSCILCYYVYFCSCFLSSLHYCMLFTVLSLLIEYIIHYCWEVTEQCLCLCLLCVIVSLKICRSLSAEVRTLSVTTSPCTNDETLNNGEYSVSYFVTVWFCGLCWGVIRVTVVKGCAFTSNHTCFQLLLIPCSLVPGRCIAG